MVQQKDTTTLEANNAKLVAQVADLKVEIAKKDEELPLEENCAICNRLKND